MASGSDHIDHVKTQLPYALLSAGVCVPVYLLIGYGGVSPWLGLAAGLVGVLVAFRLLSKETGPAGG